MNNSNKDEPVEPDAYLKKLERVQLWIVGAAILAIIIVLTPYILNFSGGMSSDSSDWGLFGDYFAGLLNPLLSFITIIVLVMTLGLTSLTLKLSREELQITREELKKSREVTTLQVKYLENESRKNELYIVIKETDQELQRVFERTADFVGNNFGYYFSYSATDRSVNEIPTHGKYSFSTNDRVAIADLCELIRMLDGYLNEYDTKFEHCALTFHYKSKYSKLYERLIEKKFLEESQFNAFNVIAYHWSAPDTENIKNPLEID